MNRCSYADMIDDCILDDYIWEFWNLLIVSISPSLSFSSTSGGKPTFYLCDWADGYFRGWRDWSCCSKGACLLSADAVYGEMG